MHIVYMRIYAHMHIQTKHIFIIFIISYYFYYNKKIVHLIKIKNLKKNQLLNESSGNIKKKFFIS